MPQSKFGSPEVVVTTQRFAGGEQVVLGTRFGVAGVQQVARFGATRIQTDVARYGAVRRQDVS